MIQSKITSNFYQRYTQHHIAKAKILGFMFGLGVVGGVLTFGGRANAVETVRLVYENHDAVVSLDDIRAFAETGQPPAQIKQFLLDNGQPAEIISRLLTEEITLPENLRQRIRSRLDKSSIGQFVLYEIDKIVQGSGNITALKNALDRTMEDRTISILELLENYTDADQVTVNLVGLRQTYNDVKSFVERVIPALEVAKDYLRGSICECETSQQTNTPETGAPETNTPETNTPETNTPSPQSQLPVNQAAPIAAASTTSCLNRAASTQSTSEALEAIPPQASVLNQSDRLTSAAASHSSQR
jgi:DNA-binding transcriptional MerR regulator